MLGVHGLGLALTGPALFGREEKGSWAPRRPWAGFSTRAAQDSHQVLDASQAGGVLCSAGALSS